MRSIRILLALATSVVLTGCINSSTLVKVKTDGSGTVEQTTLMNMGAIKGMMAGMPQGQKPAGPMMSDEELRRTAERMGKGVRLVSSEPIKNGAFEGVKAIFAFDDINQVQVTQDPGGGDQMMAGKKNDDPVKFKLTRTATSSVLTIAFQDKPAAGTNVPSPAQQPDMDLSNPMIMNMVKTMFDGFKINIALEPVGTIVKTNAEYVSGSRITLLEMDMKELLSDEAAFKQLTGKLGPDASFAEVKPYLKNVKGIKIDGPTISVEFK